MNKSLALIICITTLLFTSCHTTEQAEELSSPSGFLRDYSQLDKGAEGEALMVYKNDQVNWQKYTKIIIDPVQIWAKSDSDIQQLDRVKLEKIIGMMNSTLAISLKDNYTIVSKADQNTLRLKVALTEGKASKMILDTVSTVGPISLTLSYLSKAAKGKHLAVGKASIEAELVDSLSGERLAAGMDSRYGGKGLRGKFDSWDDVKSAFEFWANRINKKLYQLTDNEK